MYPAYSWMDSHPYHANPMYYVPKDDPRCKDIPSHMNMDSPCQPWPYLGNHCFPVPHQHDGCCNHSCFGGPYGFRPPYPHYPPPQPFYTHGFHPPFSATYPAYSVLSPHHSIEQPRYSYDKNPHPTHRCCGCTYREDDKRLKNEQEPEVDKKTSDPVVPFQLKNYPYPIMWAPTGYMKNAESEVKERDKHSHDPVPLKPLEPSKQGGNGEATRDQQGGDGYRLPFPIFWWPSRNDEVGKDIKENNLDLVADGGSPFSGNDDKKRQPRKNEDPGSEAESKMSGERAVPKVIPVKQLGTEEEEKRPKSIESKEKSSSVEKTNNGKEGKPSTKTSKIPPVCLRVDPLPRKNRSRSLSPPTDKGRSMGSPAGNEKSSLQQTRPSESLKKSKEEQSKGNIKTIKVIDNTNKGGKDCHVDPCENVPRDGETKDFGLVNEGDKRTVKDQPSKVEAGSVEKLTEHEAALVIQAAYRGFAVRKSQPLKKLRQIAEVGKQVVELRNRIQDLESSSSCICIVDKQKLIMGETIMSLLLKLDTIQGLHPIVRDIRKSTAKELLGLQEKLDSLTFIKSGTPSEEAKSSTKHCHLSVMNPVEDKAIQEKSDQAQAQSDGNVKPAECGTGERENPEVEATESQGDDGAGACDINLEPEVILQNQETTKGLNSNQPSVEDMQAVDDAIQDKFGQGQGQSDSSKEAVGLDTGIYEDREVEATESQNEGGVEAHDINPQPLVELKSQQSTEDHDDDQLQLSVESGKPDNVAQEKPDEAQAQFGINSENVEPGICEHREGEVPESQDDGDMPQVELKSEQSTGELNSTQLPMSETEQPVDNAMQQSQSGSDIENVEPGTGVVEYHEVEAKESQDHCDVETHDINLDMGSQQSTGDGASVEAVGVDASLVEQAEVKVELTKDDAAEDTLMEKNKDREEPPKVGDRKLMEENEKLRSAVEELMRAGKEQMGVITELTGRVKDLEKKLTKKKKIKVKKNRCLRGLEVGVD